MENSLFLTLTAVVALLARFAVGGVLLVAGLAKIKAPRSRFLKAILGYELVPRPVAVVLARTLPWVELIVGGLLILGLWSRIATLLAAALLIFFSSAVITSLLRGKDNDCGCFKSVTPVQMRLVYRNWFLIGLLAPVYILKGGLWAIDTGKGLPLLEFGNFQLTWGLPLIVSLWVILPVLLHRFVQMDSITNSQLVEK